MVPSTQHAWYFVKVLVLCRERLLEVEQPGQLAHNTTVDVCNTILLVVLASDSKRDGLDSEVEEDSVPATQAKAFPVVVIT